MHREEVYFSLCLSLSLSLPGLGLLSLFLSPGLWAGVISLSGRLC